MTGWKEFEDRVCRQLGGRRVLGNRGSGVPDSDEEVPFAVECKLGYERFQLSSRWLIQAECNALESRKPWLLIQKPKRVHDKGALVTMRFDAFLELARKAGMVP